MRQWYRWIAFWALVGAVAMLPAAGPGERITHAEGKAAKDNLHLLAQVTCGEARAEPYEGKVAVAAVILNRTLDDRFPDSVAGVTYQPHAFEAVTNGQIYQNTTDECFKAARAALGGWDPSNGSVYFFAPAKTANAFIWSRQQVRTIGKHIFAK